MMGYVIEFKVELGVGFFTDHVKRDGAILFFAAPSVAESYIRKHCKEMPSARIRPARLVVE